MINEHSAEWRAIRAWLENQIEELKNDLCSTRCDHDKTQRIRGKIEAYRTLMDAVQNNRA